MFVSAPVSEICDLNQEEKKKKNAINLAPFPGILPELPFEHMYTFQLIEVQLVVQ